MSHLTKLSDTVALTQTVNMPEVGVVIDQAPQVLAQAALAAGFRHLVCTPKHLPAVAAAVAQCALPPAAVFVTVRLEAAAAFAPQRPVDLVVADGEATERVAIALVAAGQAQAWACSGQLAAPSGAVLRALPLGVTAQCREAAAQARAAGQQVASELPFGRGDLALLRPLRRMAERYGKTPAQIVIRWLLQQGVWPWLPAAEAQQLSEWGQVFDFELSFHDLQVLDALDGRPMAPRKHRRH